MSAARIGTAGRRLLRVLAVPVVAISATVPVAPVALAGSHSIVITSPSDGSVVNRTVTITSQATAGTTEVMFAVSRDAGATWTTVGTDADGQDGWAADWNTLEYSGDALVRATASASEEEAFDQISVVVDNKAPVAKLAVSRRVFSPNRDRRMDRVRFSASADEESTFVVQVLDRHGNLQRRWQSTEPGLRFVVEWHGSTRGGHVRDGRYSVQLEATDASGLHDGERAGVVVDTLAPRIRSLRIGPTLFTRAGALTARFRVRDRARRVRVHLDIRDRLSRVATVSRQGPRYGEIRYRTRYKSGRVLYPGLYTARFRVSDDAGNVRASRVRPWRMHRPVHARVFTRLPGAGRRVALTFDDCNYSSAWGRILRILAAWNVKATFFCSGRQLAWQSELARRTVAHDHAIGSHGWDHALLSGRSKTESSWRMRADARFWWNMTRETTASLYRPAYGGYDRTVVDAAGATGHGRVVLWDVDSLDYRSSAGGIVARVLRDTRRGSIVLLHVLDQTAEALPGILRGLRRRELLPTDLHRMFRSAGFR